MLKGAAKDRENPHFQRKYADLASVWDACREALSKNEIAIIQPLSGGPDTITITTILVHSSGESVYSALTLRPTKPDPQGIGSAATYGRRYGLAAMVGVAPEDDDGNAASQPVKGANTKEAVKKEVERIADKASERPADGIWLSLGADGSGTSHATVSAYLDALENALSVADDANAVFELNMPTLQTVQAKGAKAKTSQGDAVVARVKAIFDHIAAGTVPGAGMP